MVICLVFPILSKEYNGMSNVIVKDVQLVEVKGDEVIKITLYNRSDETYYFHKRFIYGEYPSDVVWGFELKQNGKEIEYNGNFVKINESFPQDYRSISPNECVVLSTPINKFFDFDSRKELEINYFMSVVTSDKSATEYIEFTKILKLQEADINELFESIKRYML